MIGAPEEVYEAQAAEDAAGGAAGVVVDDFGMSDEAFAELEPHADPAVMVRRRRASCAAVLALSLLLSRSHWQGRGAVSR